MYPQSTTRRDDPFAVALGNATLLGIGYVLLRRWRHALGTTAITITLLAILAAADQPAWFWRMVLFLWWAGLTLHGWHLAGGRDAFAWAPGIGRLARWTRQRVVAFCAAGAILLLLGVTSIDAQRIASAAAEAHTAGDCAGALSTLDGFSAGHRLLDGPLANRVEEAREACELLADAERTQAIETLREYRAHPGAAWAGAEHLLARLLVEQAGRDFQDALMELGNLESAFALLSETLTATTGHEQDVIGALDAFVAMLPGEDSCHAASITDWIAARPATGDALDHSFGAAAPIAPAAILGCGDEKLKDGDPRGARSEYRRLLDEYPDHELAGDAKKGEYKAGTAIQLEEVRELLDDGDTLGSPKYCEDPAPYRGAERYKGDGPNRAMLFGDSENAEQLPKSWLAKDVADATLVICAGDVGMGRTIETCAYEGGHYIAFHETEIDVKVFEVRTGEKVADTTVRIGGYCPFIVTYYGDSPPNHQYATTTEDDVRDGYRRVIDP